MNKYDLIIEKDGKWQRVKIKTVQRWGNGSTQWNVRKIDMAEVDIYATVDRLLDLDEDPIVSYYHKKKNRFIGIMSMDFWKAKRQIMEIWCGDCEYLYIDIDIQKGTSFRCRYPGFNERYGEGGRLLGRGTPPKPAPEWCPKRKHNAKEKL